LVSETDEKWGIYRSRLAKPMEAEAAEFLSSLTEDREILLEDIIGSQAHVVMLCKQKIISENEAGKILKALENLKSEWEKGEVEFKSGVFEDVHELVESYVIKHAGINVGGKIHTGRSRNDQVALDIRLKLRGKLLEIVEAALSLIEALLEKAMAEKRTLMLLYTHTQHAQIGCFAQYLIAYIDHLIRDVERLEACYDRVNSCPLGASAIGGSTLPLNREKVKELLGFEGIVENSVDAVSARDYILEAASTASILMVHLSRIVEDLILWSSSEFNYVELPDELASPSSIMPQKKNPCILELVRSRAAKVSGLCLALLMMVKAVPTGYSRDLQDTKPPLWEALNLTLKSVKILSSTFRKLKVNREEMLRKALESYSPALDLAEALVKYSGLSIREAHRVVGALVKKALKNGVSLKEAGVNLLEKTAQQVLNREIKLPRGIFLKVTDPRKVIMERKTLGSPNPREVERMLKVRARVLKEHQRIFKLKASKLKKAELKLKSQIDRLISNA
jgi:argininosuccinate lyase